MQSAWTKFKTQSLERIDRLSNRERLVVSVAILVVGLIVIYQFYQPIRVAFLEQNQRLELAEADIQKTGQLIDQYRKLKSKRDGIEERYKKVEIKEGELSYLEGVVKRKAGVEPGNYTIKDGAVREFGGSYEQAPFLIKFTTTSLSNLVDFLSEVVHGLHPLLLSKIDISKSRAMDRLDIEVEVNSIRRVR